MAQSTPRSEVADHAGGFPIRPVPIADLLLDDDNPRLPPSEALRTQDEILALIVERYSVMELIESLASNGYFEEEPLVGVRDEADPSKFVVVEGNRRLTSLLLLLDASKARAVRMSGRIPRLTAERRAELSQVPFKEHRTRQEILPYLGYRHITGVMPWDSYSKARYVAQLVDQGQDLKDIQKSIGDRHETAPRLYRSYLVWEQARTEGLLDRPTEIDGKKLPAPPFSFLFTALTFNGILHYLGLAAQGTPKRVPEKNADKLAEVTSYLYGSEDRDWKPAIDESRQISLLSQALQSQSARARLAAGAKVEDAIDATPGEETRLEGILNRCISSLMQAVDIAVPKNANNTTNTLAKQCQDLSGRVVKRLAGEG